MRLLWTFLKVALALALVIPLSIIILSTALGVLGALLGVAVLVLRLAVIGLIGWGVFRLVTALFRRAAPRAQQNQVRELPKVDPHYEAAMRELNRELGEASR